MPLAMMTMKNQKHGSVRAVLIECRKTKTTVIPPPITKNTDNPVNQLKFEAINNYPAKSRGISPDT